jgi:uncharacterized membrane protein
MEDWNNPWVIILVLTGALTTVFGYIFLKYPPKRINWFYGYRTGSSMKSQERWDFAQRHSAREMIRAGLLMVPVGLFGGVLSLKPVVLAFASIPVTLVFFGIMIYRTETALKERFGK